MTPLGHELTGRELAALAAGQAYLHGGRLIPVVRGGDDAGGDGGDGGGDGGSGDGGGAAGKAAGEGEGGKPKSFTQEQLNAILAAQKRELLAEQPDLTELRAKAKKLDELEAANKTELEKAQAARAKAERDAEQARLDLQESRLHSAVVAEAARKNVVDPAAAVALLDRSRLDFDKDGNATNVAETLDSLLEGKPWLLASKEGARGDADQGARGGGAKQLGADALKDMSPEEIVKARKEGRLANVLAGS